MVGVAGKFKGCNTCKARRVKCDNQKPECQKCKDSGRQCGGYNRERVWILATTDDQGRCSSHPHRALSASKSTKSRPELKAKVRNRASSHPSFSQETSCRINHEFGSQFVPISDPPSSRIRCMAMAVNLASLSTRRAQNTDCFTIPSLAYGNPPVTSTSQDFSLRAICLSNGKSSGEILTEENLGSHSNVKRELSTSPFIESAGSGSDGRNSYFLEIPSKTPSTSSLTSSSSCLFLYESQPAPGGSIIQPLDRPFPQSIQTTDLNTSWKHVMGGSGRTVHRLGPEAFISFPDHHFFSRIFRPKACFHAILRRQATFLAEEDWCSIPWSGVAKTDMDRLLDIQVQLPGIFERGEALESQHPTISRRLGAKELLNECHELDQQFENWYNELQSQHGGVQYSVVSSAAFSASNIRPLADTQYQFINTHYAFLHLYFWTGKAIFYRAIQHIHTIASQVIPTASSSSLTPPPLFAPQPPMTNIQIQDTGSMDLTSQPSRNYTFSQNALSIADSNTAPMMPFYIPPDPQLSAPTTLTEDLFQYHQALLDPAAPIIPQSDHLPFFNFNVEPYMDVSVSNSTNYSISPISSSAFASTAASFTSPSRSSTPAHQSQNQHVPTSAYSSAQAPRYIEHLNLQEAYTPPPLPTVAPLDMKYSEDAILALTHHICHSLPFTLTHTFPLTTSTFMSTLDPHLSPLPTSRSTSSLSSTVGSSPNPTPAPTSIQEPDPRTNTPSTVLSDFGPDAVLWPLEVATKVFLRQGRRNEWRWVMRTLAVLKKEGEVMADGLAKGVWTEWE